MDSKIVQALKHAKQAIALYGFDVELSYKENAGTYEIKGKAYVPQTATDTRDTADGYERV